MIHYLPTIHSDKEGFERLASLAADTEKLHADRLEVDLSKCGFLDANMAASLAAVLARIADNLNAVEIVKVPSAIERVLRKNGFLLAYGYSAIDDVNQTTLPFQRIQLSDKGRFADYLKLHLKGKGIPRMTDGLGKVFKQSIFEVFQNAVIHSNYAGVPHLGGWGCEPGAGCCSPGAMMAVDEAPSTGSCGVQDPVPFGVGDAVPAESPRARSS